MQKFIIVISGVRKIQSFSMDAVMPAVNLQVRKLENELNSSASFIAFVFEKNRSNQFFLVCLCSSSGVINQVEFDH